MNYIDRLKTHLEKVISERNPKTYDEIFSNANGAFPNLVFELIKENTYIDLIKPSQGENNAISDFLPEPSPINFDWRFEKATINSFVQLFANKSSRIALFGTPSLFLPLGELGHDVWLFDINSTLLGKIKNPKINIIDINSLTTSSFPKFDYVIMDPPWYLDYYLSWFKKGSELLKNNGLIISTLFEDLLRPNAKREIRQILKVSKQIGSFDIEKGFVSYETPNFEKELFKETNIPCYSNWRRADLLKIRKQFAPIFPEISIIKDNWFRVSLFNRIIGIEKSNDEDKITLVFPYKNKDSKIKSVSNRDRTRKKLNLIISNNNGFIVTGNNKIYKILTFLAEGNDLNDTLLFSQLLLSEKNAIEEIINAIKK